MYKAWRQRKKKAACVLPVQRYTAYFWTHFHFDHSLAQRAATLQTCLNYTASNIVNTQPRNSCIQACKLCKKSYLASFGPFFIPACILRFRMTKSLKAERPGSESIMLQIQPQQLARFELRSQQNYLHDVTHTTTTFDVICLATGDTKHLYPIYLDCIWFKSLRTLRHHNLNQIHPCRRLLHQQGVSS